MLAELESRSCVRTIRPRPADLVTGLPEDVATARNEPARAGEAERRRVAATGAEGLAIAIPSAARVPNPAAFSMSSHEGSNSRIPPSQKPQEQDGTWLITTTPQRLSNVMPPVVAAMTAPPTMLEVMQTPSRPGSLAVSNATERNGCLG